MGPAGSMTIHHARLVHGSALNRSNRQRRLLLHEYTAADALPLLGVGNFDEFNGRMVVGETDQPAADRAGAGAPAAAAGRPPGLDLREPARHRRGASSRPSRTPVSARIAAPVPAGQRRCAVAGCAPRRPSSSTIGAARGSIDFAIGNSKIFRTTGSFKEWQGTVLVDDSDVPRSTVDVNVNTGSIQMMDPQQTDDAEGRRLLRRRQVPADDLRVEEDHAHQRHHAQGRGRGHAARHHPADGARRLGDRPQARCGGRRALRPLPRRAAPSSAPSSA